MNAAIKKELDDIERRHGKILPSVVVQAARDKKSAMHTWFDWDDSSAAQKYRLEQARSLIRIVVTTVNTPNATPFQTYVSLKSDRYNGGGYRSITRVLSDKERTRQMLQQALDELETFKLKYNQIKALKPVFSAADSVAGKTKTQMRKAA